MDNKGIVQKQLDQLYSILVGHRENRMRFRNWCVTITIALITIIISQKLVLTKIQSIIMLISPIFIFWVLEVMEFTYELIDLHKSEKLEELLIKDKIDSIPIELLWASSLKTKALKGNKNRLLIATILTKAILFFYGFLAIMAIIALLVV